MTKIYSPRTVTIVAKEAMKAWIHGIKHPDHRLAAEWLYTTGMRVNEARLVKVDYFYKRILPAKITKAKKQRSYYVSPDLAARVELHIKRQGLDSMDFLFVTR